MDYDDNDFHSQNLHLAGERNPNYPRVLPPYALPKFEFDESLQGHLKFDGLVETEVFLGIENSESNHWIGDYSRGGSGIEFSSTAAESCSISRCNNVWSEATSSESVEMLLKSVGQEEVIPSETVIGSLDACDELRCLTKQMEPRLKNEDEILSEVQNVTGLPSTLPSNEIPRVFSSQPHVEESAQIQQGDMLINGSSNDLKLDTVSENCGLPISEDTNFVDRTFADKNRSEGDSSVNEHLDVKQQENNFFPGMQVGNAVTSAQCLAPSSTDLNYEGAQHQVDNVNNENPDCHISGEEAEVDNQNVDRDVVDNYTCHDVKPDSFASEVETVEEVLATETSMSNVEEPSCNAVKDHPDQHLVVKCSTSQFSTVSVHKCEDVIIGKGSYFFSDQPNEVREQELPSVNLGGTPQFERHVSAEISSGLVSEMDNVVKASHEEIRSEVMGSGKPLYDASLVGKAEVSLPPVEEAKVSEGGGHEIGSSHGEDVSSLTIANYSSDVHCEKHVTGDSKGVHDSLEVSRDHLSSENQVPPSIIGEAAQKNEQVISCLYVSSHSPDGSVNRREITRLSDDYSNVDSKVREPMDQEVGLSSFGEGTTHDDLVVSELHHSAATGSELVKDVTLENPNLDSSDACDTALLPFKNGVKMNVDPQEDQMTSSSGLGLIKLDRTDEAAATEASLSSPIVSSQIEAGQGPVSEAEAGTQEISQEPDASEAKEWETKEMNSCPVSIESFQKDGDVMETMGLTQSQNGATAEKCIEKSQDASERMTKNDETHTQLGPILLEETCITDVQKFQGHNEATLVSKDKNSGQTIEQSDNKKALEIQAGSFDSVSLLKSHTKSASQEDLGGSADCNEAVCGSSKPSEGTLEKVSTNQKSPATKVDGGGANNVSSDTHVPKGNDVSRDNGIGRVDISSIVEFPIGDAGNNEKSFSVVSAPKVARRSSHSGLGVLDLKTTALDISLASPLPSDGEVVRRRAKGTPETKTRRSSAKAAGKDKKGIQVKEISPIKPSDRGDKFSNVFPSTSGIFQLSKSNEMQGYGRMEGSNTKPYFVVAASKSGLPDLNASGSQSSVFQQPFTDFQQVQLRAQIFVYGALIQGIAPEEAPMVSAFGGPGCGRSMWENAWRTCIERLSSQKSSAMEPETPLHPRFGTKAPDQVTKQSSFQSTDISSPACQSSTKVTHTTISPMIPLSSPLWSVPVPVDGSLQFSVMPRGTISNFQESFSPLHPFQTPPTRSFVGHNAPLMSQFSFRGPWVASPQSSLPETGNRFSPYPSIEAVQLNPVKETSTSHPSATKPVFSGPIVHTGDMRRGLAGDNPMPDSKKLLPSSGQQSVSRKPRKRKKSSVPEECDQIILQPLSQTEPVVAAVVTSSLPISVSVKASESTPFVSKAMSEKLIFPVSQASSTDNLKKVNHDLLHGSTLSEDILAKLKETRKQAEDAAASAASAVSHCQQMWNLLDKQKNSGLSSDVETKLESAAVQLAAAAAVAKAAAAAANVASSAALQAKLMADEAMISTTSGNSNGRSTTFSDEVVNTVGKATPASILWSDDGANSSSLIITVAREAARRGVEAASAASKRAENMDAIVKAAELAAEAVSQAGTIVAMGDPFTLHELVEAGPQGYWKVPQLSSELATKSVDIIIDQSKGAAGEFGDTSKKNSKDRRSARKETHSIVKEKSDCLIDVGKEPVDDHLRLKDVLLGSVMMDKRDSRVQMGHKFSDLSKNISVVLESDIRSESSPLDENELEKATVTSKRNCIKEGSQVEVFKDGDGQAAWFIANVLSMKDGKAYVSYPEVYLDEGLGGQLKELVELESKGDEAPKIRLSRPITAVHNEGTRKRRRAAIGDLTWSVGDRVDAWITDSWREGVITEKNKKDETSLTVNFPAQGVTSVVKAWHLRPSLTWKDGQWVEWSNLQNDSSLESDMPKEKRPKLGNSAVEAQGKDNTSKSNVVLGKAEETRSLNLSSNEKVFKIGKNTRTENNPYSTRTLRTGLQEGSRGKFCAPKPGKKRKFMEVSKHYVSDQANKINETIVPAKPGLSNRGSGTQGLRNTSKNDSKEKRGAESNLKGLKFGKQQIVSARSIPQKERFHNTGTFKDRTRTKGPPSQVGTTSGKDDTMETGSYPTTEGAAENPTVFSSAPASDAASKRVPNGKDDRTNKEKVALASGKLGKREEDQVSNDTTLKTTSGAVEPPRRSNRKMQPTSRLLEGLQSSLIISKIPSFSHDRGHKSQNRSNYKRE